MTANAKDSGFLEGLEQSLSIVRNARKEARTRQESALTEAEQNAQGWTADALGMVETKIETAVSNFKRTGGIR